MDIFSSIAEDFERRMRDLSSIDDKETRHRVMDQLMCEILEQFGCYEGVKIFKETSKWYA